MRPCLQRRAKALTGRFRAGDLVKVRGSRRKWVVLPVTREDVRRGANVRASGLHLFGGYWYASEAIGGPLSPKAYGKVIELEGRVVGRVRGHYAALRHCR